MPIHKDIIIIDNTSIYKSMEVKELIESKKRAKLIYQLPYTSILNKIENYWDFIKKKMLCNNGKYI
jgi:transposase